MGKILCLSQICLSYLISAYLKNITSKAVLMLQGQRKACWRPCGSGKKTEKTNCDPTDSNANAFFFAICKLQCDWIIKVCFPYFFPNLFPPSFPVFPWHLPGMAQRLGSSWPTHLVLSQDLAYWGLNAVGGEVPSGTGQIWFILMAFWWHIDGKKNLVNTCKIP